MSLPKIFGTDTGNIPANIPYPCGRSGARDVLERAAFGPAGTQGGAGQGGESGFSFHHARSIPPALLDPLAGAPGVSFVNLQVGTSGRPKLAISDWTAELVDFAETAALIMALDLVIGVDTAVVHLAGALGRPVWLLNRFASDWRWGKEGDRSAWYPTLRQFRQARPGAWTQTIEQVRGALETG